MKYTELPKEVSTNRTETSKEDDKSKGGADIRSMLRNIANANAKSVGDQSRASSSSKVSRKKQAKSMNTNDDDDAAVEKLTLTDQDIDEKTKTV